MEIKLVGANTTEAILGLTFSNGEKDNIVADIIITTEEYFENVSAPGSYYGYEEKYKGQESFIEQIVFRDLGRFSDSEQAEINDNSEQIVKIIEEKLWKNG